MWMVFVGVLMVIDAVLTFQSFFSFVNEIWVYGKVSSSNVGMSFEKLSKKDHSLYVT